MSRIETRTIKAPRKTRAPRPTDELAAHKRREAAKARERGFATYRSDGVTRCSRCPPTSQCDYCAGINRGRIMAGLIRPREDPTPHPNNCLIPVMEGPLRGARPAPRSIPARPVITACVRPLGRGWRLGVAMLNGIDVYVSKPLRTVEAAMAFANEHRALIREGLEYELEML